MIDDLISIDPDRTEIDNYLFCTCIARKLIENRFECTNTELNSIKEREALRGALIVGIFTYGELAYFPKGWGLHYNLSTIGFRLSGSD